MPSRHYCIREFGYITDNAYELKADNLISLPSRAFASLLEMYDGESSADKDIQPFLRLTRFKRKPALQVQNYVGVIQTACGTQVEVLPKLFDSVSKGSDLKTRALLLRMLRTLRDSPFKQAGQANVLDTKMPLLEVYISLFLSQVNTVVKRGLRSDYIKVQKNSKFLKGRLMVSKQLQKNSIHPERSFVEYFEYQVDRPANRLIKSALSKIARITNSSANQRLARELGFIFEEVPESTNYSLDFKCVKLDRGMSYYHEALSWSKLLLMGHGPTTAAGSFSTLSLLYPMERIFEDYVTHCLRTQAVDVFGAGSSIKSQFGGKSLVEEHLGKTIFRMRPDLQIIKCGVTTWVLDTKWKLLDQRNRAKKYGISQSDMYQLYAYGKKFMNSREKNLMLIYPMTEKFSEPLPVFNYEDGFSLWVVPFDIEQGRLLPLPQ